MGGRAGQTIAINGTVPGPLAQAGAGLRQRLAVVGEFAAMGEALCGARGLPEREVSGFERLYDAVIFPIGKILA